MPYVLERSDVSSLCQLSNISKGQLKMVIWKSNTFNHIGTLRYSVNNDFSNKQKNGIAFLVNFYQFFLQKNTL
jgi:hypothetical protein